MKLQKILIVLFLFGGLFSLNRAQNISACLPDAETRQLSQQIVAASRKGFTKVCEDFCS